MENDIGYQQQVRRAIWAAPTPLPVSPWPYIANSGYRRPHSDVYIVDGVVVPPTDVAAAIKAIHIRMNRPNHDKRLKNKKVKQVDVDLQGLFRIWWLSGDLCNLSGVKVSWESNDVWKAAFDRIVPGGPYAADNIQILANCINTAKWDHSNDDAVDWMSNFKVRNLMWPLL